MYNIVLTDNSDKNTMLYFLKICVVTVAQGPHVWTFFKGGFQIEVFHKKLSELFENIKKHLNDHDQKEFS